MWAGGDAEEHEQAGAESPELRDSDHQQSEISDLAGESTRETEGGVQETG